MKPEDESQLLKRLMVFFQALLENRNEACLETRLNRLCPQLRPLLAAQEEALLKAQASHLRKRPKLANPAALINALASIKPLLDVARASGALIDPWAASGLKRNEVRNAGVLALLWSPTHGGIVAIEFLGAFLDRVSSATGLPLPHRAELAQGYLILTEDCPLGESSERVDITIETATTLIGIEVKIDEGEGPRQLERYKEAISQRARHAGKDASIIFLAPFRSSLHGVASAQWADVAAAGRSILPRKRSGWHHNHQLIESFSRHVLKF